MNNIISVLKKSNRIAVTFHESPDGDSLGSSIALILGLRLLNKDAYIISKEPIPETFSFLSNSYEIDGKCFDVKENTDCLIALDCGNTLRLNCTANLQNRSFTLINIDHHISNDLYGDLNFVDTNAASVGEIIYQLLKLMDIEIDVNIAAALYTSLLTDTGSFRHSNTTSVTHTIAGDLINTGLDFSSIHRNIFENKKYEIIKLHGLVINNMTLTENKKVCVLRLTNEMLIESKVTECDSAELVSIGLKIGSVEVAVLLKEKENGVKISLRSKSSVDVRKIAEKFGGGGHIRAAGLSMNESINEAEKIILLEIEKELI